MSLDLDVAARQAFGFAYRPEDVANLLDGRLVMSPHPQWRLPKEISWREDPFKDRNWKFQFHMLRWLDPLRRAAAKDGNDEAYAMWRHHLRDWVEKNPRSGPRSPWAWKDMSDGIRARQLCVAAPLVAQRSPEDLDWLEESIREHAEHLADPAKMGIANHLLHQADGLFVCGRILHEPELCQLALDRMGALIMEQYDEQGVNAEGAIAYHDSNFLWWERALRTVDVENVPRPPGTDRHRSAPEEIAHATRPDGTLVMIGDTDPYVPKSVKSPFIQFVTSGGQKGRPPEDLVKVYGAGYVFARSGWGETERNFSEETFYSISFGSSRRVHGHPDGGSITYSADRVNWIVDPGKYLYGKDPYRDHFFSRAAHSLVSIDGREPAREALVSLTSKQMSARHQDFVFSDDSFPGISLTRRVVHSVRGEYLIVIDQVISDQEVTAIQRWQLGADVESTTSQHRVELSVGEHRAALIFAGTQTDLEEVCGQKNPVDGWISTGWKQKAPATAILARKTGSNFRIITVIAAGAGAHPTIRSFPSKEPGGFGLRVDTGRMVELIDVGRNSVTFPSAPPAARSTAGATAGASGAAARQTGITVPPAPETPVGATATGATRSGRPHPEDRDSRAALFDVVAAAREEAWEAPAARREQLAEQIRSEATARGLGPDLDLGTSAAIHDLRGTIVGKGEQKLVQSSRTALIDWDAQGDWRPTGYPFPVRSHRHRLALPGGPGERALHTVTVGPLVLPLALDPAPGDTLTVLFHGALDRARIRLPMFQRWSQQLALDAGPTVAVGDPTLDLSGALGLGWYLGTEKTDLVPAIAESIATIASSLGASRIVLVGGSGGGFAALHVSAHLPDAVAVVMSPQNDLRRYSSRLTRAASIPALGRSRIPTEGSLVKRIHVAERLRVLRSYPRTVLISNLGDEHHRVEHERPLVEAFQVAGHGNLIRTVDLDLGAGHRPVDAENYARILGEVYSSS
ncbi:heparinase II/III family protein [Brachybacterium tyrofermentans]|uniref:heparinase II/III family protein n=1 Tax=Brachybacterium tyrofermentans TaxID=47848 RepID=UPI003FD6A9A4